VVVERKVLDEFNIAVGESVVFELPDGSTKSLEVVGIAQDPTTGADDFLAPPFVYITMDTLPTLRQPETFNRVYATVSENENDDAHIRTLAADLKDRIEKSGVSCAHALR
jgi:hypothetical protein